MLEQVNTDSNSISISVEANTNSGKELELGNTIKRFLNK